MMDYLWTFVLCIGEQMLEKRRGRETVSHILKCPPCLFENKALLTGAAFQQQLVQKASSRLVGTTLVQVWLYLVVEGSEDVCSAHDSRLQAK